MDIRKIGVGLGAALAVGLGFVVYLSQRSAPVEDALDTVETAAPVTVEDEADAAVLGPVPDAPQEPEVPRAPASAQIHGRLIDDGTGDGVPGATVRRIVGKKNLGEAVTDETGAFAIPLTNSAARRLEIELPVGWEMPRKSVRMSKEERDGTEAIVVRVTRVDRYAIQGVALDAATGEHVPYCRLTFQRSGATESVETDAEGLFQTETLFGEGKVYVSMTEPPDKPEKPVGRIEHPDPQLEGGRLALELEVGPTYTLDLHFPADGTASTRDLEAVLSMAAERYYTDSTTRLSSPLRSGSEPWVRFPRSAGPSSGWVLDVRDRSGYLRGEARVTSAVGIYPEVVRVGLSQTGVVRGRVLGEDGSPLGDLRVYLDSTAGHQDGLLPRGYRIERGGFSFSWLAPGRYELRALKTLHKEAVATVDVVAGEVTSQDLVMERNEIAGPVSGRLTSASGGWTFLSTQVELVPVDGGPHERMYVLVKPNHGGDGAEFVFEEVPRGEYWLRVIANGHRPWEPPFLHVTAPASGLVLRLDDTIPTAELTFRVHDAGTGDALDQGTVVWRLPDGSVEKKETWGRLRRVHEDCDLQWAINAPGYAAAFGSLDDFKDQVERAPHERTGKAREPQRIATVSLEPGWGGRVRVRDQSGAPLPGVALRSEGSVLGTTGDGGTVAITLAERPREVVVQREGWKVASHQPRVLDVLDVWGEVEIQMVKD